MPPHHLKQNEKSSTSSLVEDEPVDERAHLHEDRPSPSRAPKSRDVLIGFGLRWGVSGGLGPMSLGDATVMMLFNWAHGAFIA